MKSKVYFFIGTKAQAIKCLPVIKYFVDKLEIEIIDSGQHRKIVDEIYTSLNLNIEKNILQIIKTIFLLISPVLVGLSSFYLNNYL